ncbi:MAG TPA: haloacid dehalogenase type II [Gammaproteobacteria bacterium]|nr:haloacid dehalogenase type II [Gammaproteobacteria bacterium]
MNKPVLAFDVYGTLIDTAGIAAQLRENVGDRATAFAQLWREKQLEYTFRRGLMQRYEIFPECTRRALEYCCAALDAPLDDASCERLLAAYRVLPAYPDALTALAALQDAGRRMFAFSNGIREDIESLLGHAGIADYFEDIVSVDEIGTFKPNPDVYRHFLQRASAEAADAWLISGNPFDVIGALATGMRAAWVRRSPAAVFDPWEFEPTATITSLVELDTKIATA